MTQALPLIPDAIRVLGDAIAFTTLDLKNGYWQIPLDTDSRNYTAFATPYGGTYRFRVMPFALKTATNTFQTLVAHIVLQGYLNHFCIVYLDDIIIYSKSFEEHILHVNLVQERLAIHGRTCAIVKCARGRKQVQNLGHLDAGDSNQTQETHIGAIQEASIPLSKKELQ